MKQNNLPKWLLYILAAILVGFGLLDLVVYMQSGQIRHGVLILLFEGIIAAFLFLPSYKQWGQIPQNLKIARISLALAALIIAILQFYI